MLNLILIQLTSILAHINEKIKRFIRKILMLANPQKTVDITIKIV